MRRGLPDANVATDPAKRMRATFASEAPPLTLAAAHMPTHAITRLTLTLEAARSLRDGAIDAAAALDDALRDAFKDLAPQNRSTWARATGRAMAAIFDEVLNPVIAAYPELEADQSAWVAIAQARAGKRSSS